MRNERTMNAVAVAEEADIVCSFIFKNRWAARNLDKIGGQHSSELNAIGVRPRHLGRTNATFIWYKVKMSPKVSERFRRPTLQTFFFFQAEDGIRDVAVTGVQTCALPI